MFLPLSRRHLGFLEGTPPIAISVEGSVTGDGDVLCIERIERRGTTFGRNTFEPLVVDLIQIEVMAEDDEAVLLRVKPHVGLKRDRSRGVDTFRDNDRTAAFSRTLVNSRLDSFCSEGYTGVVCSEIQHVEGAVRERRDGYFRHIKRCRLGQRIDVALLGRLVLRRIASTENSCSQQQEC